MIRPEDVEKLDQAINMLNQMVEKVEIIRESDTTIVIKYHFKNPKLAEMYLATLKVAFGTE